MNNLHIFLIVCVVSIKVESFCAGNLSPCVHIGGLEFPFQKDVSPVRFFVFIFVDGLEPEV